jgi:hypothetical protein
LIFGSLRLEYKQLFPVPNNTSKKEYVEAATWATGTNFLLPGIKALTIRGVADDLTAEFVKAYSQVNHK